MSVAAPLPDEGDDKPEKKKGKTHVDHKLLRQWLGHQGKRPIPPSRLSKNTVDSDKWDRKNLQRMQEEMKEFEATTDKLAEHADTGDKLMDDTYFSMLKVDPKLVDRGKIRPSHIVNRKVMEEAMDLKEYEDLRNYSVGDEVAAAMACCAIEPDLETLLDKLDKEREKGSQIDEWGEQLGGVGDEARSIEDMMKDLDPDSPENQQQAKDWQERLNELEAQAEELRQKMAQGIEELDEALERKTPGIRQAMKDAMNKAGDEAEGMAQLGDGWGLEPGALQKMPAAERFELAKRFSNPRLKKIADLIGPMKRLMFTEQTRKTIHGRDEIYDITIGNDLGKTLPVEFAQLRNPLQRRDFYRKYIEGKLLQYETRGYEKVGKGGIIFCEDGSGSMSGEPEMWAKAVGISLLNLAKAQKREFYGIHFGSPGQVRVFDFTKPEHFTLEKVLEFAETFFGGGTDFVTPLTVALERLEMEYEARKEIKGDIVFVTDGCCGVPPAWLDEFQEKQKRLQFNVWGVIIGGTPRDEPLATICNHRVLTLKDLTGGDDIRGIFRAL